MRHLDAIGEQTKKKKVLLHYYQYGTQRSPNDQFDILSAQKLISDNYDLRILNQEYTPKEIGSLRSVLLLRKKIRDEDADIVHISGVKEGFHCMIAAVLAGCKKRILITHGFAGLSMKNSCIRRFFFRWIIEPITLLLATDVQCNSYFSMNVQMIRLFARKKSKLIYNFLKPISVKPKYWRRENNICDDNIVITTIGNMHSGKGYDLLEKVIDHFSENKKIRFVVIGDGPLKEDFDHDNIAHIQSKRLLSLGKCSHDLTMQILSESDVFFLPTRFETLGMVFAEAGYLGIPCVATSVGAVEEIIKDEHTGLIVPSEDISACIVALEKLIANQPYRNELGMNAKKYISEMFSARIITERILKMYR